SRTRSRVSSSSSTWTSVGMSAILRERKRPTWYCKMTSILEIFGIRIRRSLGPPSQSRHFGRPTTEAPHDVGGGASQLMNRNEGVTYAHDIAYLRAVLEWGAY